jgi:hypothetical protein
MDAGHELLHWRSPCAADIRTGGRRGRAGRPVLQGQGSIYIGFATGGTYDYFGRVAGRFIGRHIPGNPTVVAQHARDRKPAGGNYLTPGPRDGTAWGVVTQTLVSRRRCAHPRCATRQRSYLDRPHLVGAGSVFHLENVEARTIEDARLYETPVTGTGWLAVRLSSAAESLPAPGSRSSRAIPARPRA